LISPKKDTFKFSHLPVLVRRRRLVPRTNVKISKWGVQIDMQLLIVFAVLSFLGWIVNTVAVPVAPSLWMKFGGVVIRFISVCGGPMWYALAQISSIMTLYVGISPPGLLPDLLLAVIPSAVWTSLLDKYLPPLLGVYPALPSLSISYFTQVLISGYPPALAFQIFLKSIANTLIITLLFTLLIAFPYIHEILPLRYDSWVARYWLLRLEDVKPEG
jgi:hypothetical protein